ncbi:Alpha/Beta hydrolase protein [Dissophora ornata]|nr:Alpha/Beta hydrolase protein [Dissophora ornata]
MDMETVSQFLLGNHPSWEFLNSTETGSRILFHHQEKPLVIPLLILLPFLLTGLFRYYTASPVVLSYSKDPVRIRLHDRKTGSTTSENFIDYIKRTCPTLTDPSKGAVFKPTLWMTSGHFQTAYAAYRNFEHKYIINYERELLSTPDGGTVSIDWAPSFVKKPVDDTPTLVLLHGLTGGSYESYLRALIETLTKDHGYRCVVFNARACADTEVTSPQLYCGSWTDDLRIVVKHVRKTLPEAKLMSVGFSLGSNILMNYMGEEGDNCEFLGAMSVGNPFDLLGTCYNMERGFLQHHIYSPTMGGNLKNIFFKHAKVFENSDCIDIEEVKRAVTIRQFDECVTRRIFKYRTVHEYYRMASCSQRILDIKRPFLCLSAEDDPIAVEECIPRDEIVGNPYGLLATTAHGGHLGWFEGFIFPTRWCTKPLAEFCIAMFEADRRPISKTSELSPVVDAATAQKDANNQSHLDAGAAGSKKAAATRSVKILN